MRRTSIAALTAVFGASLACNTVASEPPPECRTDQDCGENLVCSLAQGNVCVAEVQPPRADLGFDIDEGDFRIELTGCDPEVTLEPGGAELRVRSRNQLAREFEFSITELEPVESCASCVASGFTCSDSRGPFICEGPTQGKVLLSQNSRLGLAALEDNEDFVVSDPLPDGEIPAPANLAWPKYDNADDPKAHWAARVDVRPLENPEEPAPYGVVRRVISDSVGDGPIELQSHGECHRGIYGGVGTVRVFQEPTGLDGVSLEFSYAEPVATDSTVIGEPLPCADVEPTCPLGWSCAEDDTCALDLTGLSATTATTFGLGGFLSGPLYTYCEGVPSPPEDPQTLDLRVRVTPPAGSGLPLVAYDIDQAFPELPSPGFSHDVQLSGDPKGLCFPPWQPPHAVTFSALGSPVKLAENELGTYECCSTSCLPIVTEGVEPTPPPVVEDCTGFASATFETRWFLPVEDALLWGISGGCATPGILVEGANGRYLATVLGECSEPPCFVVPLTHGEIDETGRSYTISIIQDTTSVHRSQVRLVTVDATTIDFGGPFELEPRVLLRGRIQCAEGTEETCVHGNAEIKAERLRVNTDEPNPLGPYYFEGTSDLDGNFVLPVEPGVYVVTAFPEVGELGGPAQFQVIDLRLQSPLVTMVGGVPTAQLEDPIELDEGVLVRAYLRDFDVDTEGISPLDVGSWRGDPAFDEFDLNLPTTCHDSSGCLIRSLTAAPLTLSLQLDFQFTARTGGNTQCAE